MLEVTLFSFVAWLLLAAASFKHRRQLGIASPLVVRGLRVGAAALLAATLLRCGTGLDGERWVRFLGGASLGGALMVLLLSVAPAATLSPVALLIYLARRPSATAAGSKANRRSGSAAA